MSTIPWEAIHHYAGTFWQHAGVICYAITRLVSVLFIGFVIGLSFAEEVHEHYLKTEFPDLYRIIKTRESKEQLASELNSPTPRLVRTFYELFSCDAHPPLKK